MSINTVSLVAVFVVLVVVVLVICLSWHVPRCFRPRSFFDDRHWHVNDYEFLSLLQSRAYDNNNNNQVR